MNTPIVQAILLLSAVWMVLTFVQRWLGSGAILLLVVIATVIASTLYLLRYQRELCIKMYQYRVGKWIVDAVCWLTNQQVPTSDKLTSDPGDEYMLREARDFAWALKKMKSNIFGHDAELESLLVDLSSRLALRRQTEARREHGPSAIYLLAGPAGVGKRFIAESLAGLLFKRGLITVIDLALAPKNSSPVAYLLGEGTSAGCLTTAVRKHPQQIVYLDNAQLLDVTAQQRLVQLMQTGVEYDSSTRGNVYFAGVILILAVSMESACLPSAGPESQQLARDLRNEERLQEALVEKANMDLILLAQVHMSLMLREPDLINKARVVAQMIDQHCSGFGLSVQFVSPEILAHEAAAFRPSHGFQLVQSGIIRKLQKLILRAKQDKQTNLSLEASEWPLPLSAKVIA